MILSAWAAVRRAGPRKTIFISLAAALILWAVFVAWHGVSLAITARALQAQLDQPNPAQLVKQVRVISGNLRGLRAAFLPLYPVLKAMQPLPGVGPLLGQAPYLLDYGTGLAQTGDYVLRGVSPLLEKRSGGGKTVVRGVSTEGGQASASERALAALVSGQPQFDRAVAPLMLAARARPHLRPEVLPERFQALFARVDGLFDLLGPGLDLLHAAPALLGQDEPVNFLVLAQNRDELRPTGGFISGIGVLQFDQGRLAKFDMGDSYRIDDFSKGYPRPPEPIERFMLAGYWVPRDANWSPDFPTSARQAQSLYTLSTGETTHGVIAFDQSAVRSILQVTGPVRLASFPEPVGADNVEQFMLQAWSPDAGQGISKEWWEHRKDFMKELGSALLKALTEDLDPKKMAALARQAQQMLENGHLLLYFEDPRAQGLLNQMALDGAVRPGEADFLQLVDTNMGFNKVDAVVQRSLTYRLDFQNLQQPVAELVISYTHTSKKVVDCTHIASYGSGAYEDMQARCYWDYWRIYTAAGSRLLAGQSPVVPAEHLLNKQAWPGIVEVLPSEAGANVYGGMLVLPAASMQQVKLQLALPETVIREQADGSRQYRLRIAKQAGIDKLPVTLLVRLPEGAAFEATEGWTQSEEGWRWQGRLITARDFAITFIPAR